MSTEQGYQEGYEAGYATGLSDSGDRRDLATLRRLFAMPGMTVLCDLTGGTPEFVIPMRGLHEHLGLTEEEFIAVLPDEPTGT